MKAFYIFITVVLLHITAHSQSKIIQTDTTAKDLKNYLEKNIKYSSIALKDYTQGTMVVSFKINKDGKINDIHVTRYFDDLDSIVVKALNNYSQAILLPPNEYTIGLQFFILDDGKPDSEIVPIDKSRYKNFLFELVVTSELIPQQVTVY